jgi:hypothetical protein
MMYGLEVQDLDGNCLEPVWMNSEMGKNWFHEKISLTSKKALTNESLFYFKKEILYFIFKRN